MRDAVPAQDDRGEAACDHSEKKGGCDDVFRGKPFKRAQVCNTSVLIGFRCRATLPRVGREHGRSEVLARVCGFASETADFEIF
jgi:hypothetical protein